MNFHGWANQIDLYVGAAGIPIKNNFAVFAMLACFNQIIIKD
jgi:hypothetical protein